ncbi:zinc knuckle CX2CX4HX4C containing protein [Tanacetum coccineum]|uniref:Zinc knuckle CX2CX4HX4C containing protein n=1 Tax=Tanacetum coccineum TaxID=301880 RepID=A0ABQ5FPL9_9ASTR
MAPLTSTKHWLTKDDITSVPVWVKLHDVPIAAFAEDGLSMIATKLSKPLMLDAYTSTMCLESWGRTSYARALIETTSDQEMKENLVVAIPRQNGKGYTMENVWVEYEWKPLRCGACNIWSFY